VIKRRPLRLTCPKLVRRIPACALLIACFCFLPTAHAEQEKILAQAFRWARQVRSFDRLQAVAVLASDPVIAKGIQSGAKGAALLPKEESLVGASWIAVVGASGDRLAARGEAPVDIGRRAATQKALLSFLRDDLIPNPSGPLYIAAAPIGLNGKVIGALVVAWPEANQLQEFAKSTCDCQALLMVGDDVVSGDALSATDATALVQKFQATKSIEIQTAPTSQKKIAAYLPLSGELSDASYLLLFEPVVSVSVAAVSSKRDPLPPLLVLISSLLLGFVLLMMLRASKREKPAFDEASFMLRLPSLYQEFLDAKVRCGESVDALTPERFSLKVREICALFAKAYNQPKISVSVTVKNGRAQVVAAPET
jgi:hypothetical protein